MNFTDNELSTIANALRVARDQFVKDATYMRELPGEAYKRLARQFDKQHAETEALAVRIAEEEGY